jgi:hypothetical protein
VGVTGDEVTGVDVASDVWVTSDEVTGVGVATDGVDVVAVEQPTRRRERMRRVNVKDFMQNL